MGGVDYNLVGLLEPSVRYHPCNVRFLTLNHYLVKEQFQAGSLTGAVASQTVTEAYEGKLTLKKTNVKSIIVYCLPD